MFVFVDHRCDRFLVCCSMILLPQSDYSDGKCYKRRADEQRNAAARQRLPANWASQHEHLVAGRHRRHRRLHTLPAADHIVTDLCAMPRLHCRHVRRHHRRLHARLTGSLVLQLSTTFLPRPTTTNSNALRHQYIIEMSKGLLQITPNSQPWVLSGTRMSPQTHRPAIRNKCGYYYTIFFLLKRNSYCFLIRYDSSICCILETVKLYRGHRPK